MDSEEVCRMRHESLEKDLNQLIVALNTYVRAEEVVFLKESFEQRVSAVEEELGVLKAERTWMIRLVIGAIIVAVMSLVLISGPITGAGT